MLRDRLFSVLEARLSRVGMPLSVDCWNGWHLQTGEQPRLRLRLREPSALRALIRPRLGKLAESYVKNIIDVDGRIADVIRFGNLLCAADNSEIEDVRSGAPRTRWFRKRLTDREAVARHYDVSNDFYALWLDRQRVYSCAYFKTPDDSLDLAQEQKIEHICRKLQLAPGDRLLDVGCGWGALIFHAVERYNVYAVGITLSQQQHDYVQSEIAARGLGQRMQVRLQHYQEVPATELFDKISSVGMFEHVGAGRLPDYFKSMYERLVPGGLMLNHGITAGSPDNTTGLGSDISEFIEKYVFPGGELVHLYRVIELGSRAGLEVTDVESLRPHYARTLWAWVDRLEANQETALRLVGDERYRIWRIYMAGSAHAFERGWLSVHQVLAGKPKGDGSLSIPLTRAHVYDGAQSSASIAEATTGVPL